MSKGKRGKPLIIPLFIPNEGCPHRCVFCHQEKITNQPQGSLDGNAIKEVVQLAVQAGDCREPGPRQVAFYGGTFTSLSIERMRALLGAVQPFLRVGLVESIRVSTRPDAVDTERVSVMREYGVSTVELGAQSMDDEVLRLTKRGHGAEDTVRSITMLKEHGFQVGIQLMPGLPGDSREKFRRTVERVIELRPDMARLYPVLVIKGTQLAEWFLSGSYKALELEEALEICEESCMALEREGIPVIRIGLLTPPSLFQGGQVLAGPWHGCFGYLVRAGIHLKKIAGFLPGHGEAKRIRIRALGQEIPLIRGFRNQGLCEIERVTGATVIGVVPDESVEKGRIEWEKVA